MPNYEFRVRFDEPDGPVTLSLTHRRLCQPVRGQGLRFKYGPVEYWLRVASIESRASDVPIVYLRPEGLTSTFLKSAKWEEIKE